MFDIMKFAELRYRIRLLDEKTRTMELEQDLVPKRTDRILIIIKWDDSVEYKWDYTVFSSLAEMEKYILKLERIWERAAADDDTNT